MIERTPVEYRKPIWSSISEFYLDTELEDSDYQRIARVLLDSKLEFKELKQIDLFEVFPVVKSNLFSVAGVWGGFDKVWLYASCEKAYQKKDRPIFQFKTRVYHFFFKWMTKEHWDKIEEHLKTIDMVKLTIARIEENLKGLKGWNHENGSIVKTFQFADFKEAFAAMTRIAFEAEKANHHPDWENVYNRLTIRLNTHDAGGITKKDFDLAITIEAVLNR